MADDDREILQRFMDSLFSDVKAVRRLDAILRAEALDLPDELCEIVSLLPPGTLRRQQVADQLNSALKGHGWNGRFGSVD